MLPEAARELGVVAGVRPGEKVRIVPGPGGCRRIAMSADITRLRGSTRVRMITRIEKTIRAVGQAIVRFFERPSGQALPGNDSHVFEQHPVQADPAPDAGSVVREEDPDRPDALVRDVGRYHGCGQTATFDRTAVRHTGFQLPASTT